MPRLLFIVVLLFSISGFSQEMSITGPDITQCGGFLVDDGLSSSNYSNNLNATITVCAEAPETIVNLYWAVFALGSGDSMEIYDGSSTAAPLIGTFTGSELQATDITSSLNGCLTVHFVSDGNGVGNFGAEISCGPPCERPYAVINTSEAVPLLICPGETVSFDASQSVFYNGAQMQSFQWVFDDGTTNSTSWPTVTHTFDTPGGYVVQLLITDDNDCNSANLPDHTILVSTYPDFSLMSPNFDLCVGGSDFMGVNFAIPDSIYASDSLNTWISNPWNDLPDIDLGGALFIPDDQSQCFSDEVTFSNFDLGQSIQTTDDIDSFYINFEHSFIGDITISFICPNGQSLIVHQQGGGGTFAGEPIDDDSDLDPGIGYDYWWSPDATNGTWEDNSGGTIPSGTYESVQDFSNLIGCPLNGTWTVEICDMWASDNGFIFDWGINFDPDLFGDLLSFTPVYGYDCDSTWWEGPNIIYQDGGCDFIQIELLETGSYDYTYYATNNFGCTFDTTIVVDVFIAPSVNAGPDIEFGCDPVGLSATLDGQPMDYVFEWSPATGLNNPNSANPILQTVSGPVTYTLTGYPVGYPGCATSDEMDVTLDPSLPFPGSPTNVQLCSTSPPFNMMDEMLGNPTLGGFWHDPNGNLTDETFDPTTDAAGVYQYYIIYEDCELNTPMTVVIANPDITISNDTTVCIGGAAISQILSTTDFNGSYQYQWSTGQIGQQITLNNLSEPVEISVVAVDAGGCESEPEIMNIAIYDALQIETFVDTVICQEGLIDVEALSWSGGHGAYDFAWTFNNASIGSGISIDDYDPISEGTFCVRVEDQCETPAATDCFYMAFEDPMVLTIDADTTRGCVPFETNLYLTNDPASYMLSSVGWDYGPGGGIQTDEVQAMYPSPGIFDVALTLQSARGCWNTQIFENYITVFQGPNAQWYGTPQPTTFENPEITFTNLSTGSIIAMDWTFEQNGNWLGSSTEENPIFMFPSNAGATYDVSLAVTDINNCRSEFSAPIVIGDIFSIYIPTAFTPNGDGINEYFKVEGADIDNTDFHIVIFNRWGETVFESNDPNEVWLGGFANNSDYFAPNGVYNYIVKIGAKSTTERFERRGVVSLIR